MLRHASAVGAWGRRRKFLGTAYYPLPPRAQEPAMHGTKGRFLRTLFPPKIRPRNQGLVLAHDRGQPRTAEKKNSIAFGKAPRRGERDNHS